jgi:3'-phosphoadenosine 5'-phosphosulfate sulfotransferase (PAPS reductase)/FAD synthetase
MTTYQADAFAPAGASNTIAVWFSCGAASAVAALKTLEKYSGQYQVRIINNPVIEEDEDNLRFKDDIEKLLGVKIETATNKDYPNCSAVEVWERTRFMSHPHGAPCTSQLKKEARRQWEQANNPMHHVLGFTADEQSRHNDFVASEREILPVLIDAKLTKQDCFEIIAREGIARPRIYEQGYPNANCIGCVKATSPTYWNHVRRVHPAIFKERAEQSRELGAKLTRVNNQRIYLDELDPNAQGRPMKGMSFECGIFCEERRDR